MEITSPFLNNISTLGLFLLLLFSFIILNKTRANKHKYPPEAAGAWPIIGHLRLLGGSNLPHETLGAMADKHGPMFTIQVGVHKTLVISSWEVAKECYTTHDTAISSRPKNIAGKLLGYNFAGFGFRPYDSFYRNMRKIIVSKLLSNRGLDLQRDVRICEVKRSIKELYNLWTKREEGLDDLALDMDEWINNINLNVILMMVCGKRFIGNEDMRHCCKVMRDFFYLAGQFMVGDAIPFVRWLDLGGYEKAMKITSKELDSLIGEWLQEHRLRRESGDADDGGHDFMDVMLSILEEEGMDLAGYDADTVNKATCMTLIAGGTDTMTVTLTWAISLLLNNREALRKVQEELDIHVGNKRLVEESDINKLIYLQAVVKEAFRLYPAGPLSGVREFNRDCTVGGYDVTAGTQLITNLWKIQTDPRVWEEALEFKPERFLSGSHKDLDVKGQSFELAPFGYGRRACPGAGFGVQMTQLVLGSLIHCFEIGTPLDEPVDMAANFGLIIHRANPLQVLVKPRLLASAYA